MAERIDGDGTRLFVIRDDGTEMDVTRDVQRLLISLEFSAESFAELGRVLSEQMERGIFASVAAAFCVPESLLCDWFEQENQNEMEAMWAERAAMMGSKNANVHPR